MNVAPPIRAPIQGITTVTAGHVPALAVYGEPGIGKTSLAASFPNIVFLQTEAGLPAGIEAQSFGLLKTFAAVMAAMAELYKADHPYTALAVDSVSELQKLVWAETCGRHGAEAIDAIPYGKGYGLALNVWGELIEGWEALRRDRGMMVVLVAHSVVRRFNDPETAAYDRYEPDLHDKAASLVLRWCDAVLLLKRPAIIRTEDAGFNKKRSRAEPLGNAPVIHTTASPAFIAKNRFNMPPVIRFEQGAGFDALAPYLPRSTATQKGKE